MVASESPEIERLRQTVDSLSVERENLLNALRKKEREITDLRVDGLNTELKVIKEELDNERSTCISLRQELVMKDNDIANLHYQHQNSTAQMRDMHQELQVLLEEKQAIQEDNEELRKAMANAKDEV